MWMRVGLIAKLFRQDEAILAFARQQGVIA
jgi:hypothetical protein